MERRRYMIADKRIVDTCWQ